MVTGRVMVVDRIYAQPPYSDPEDLNDRLFGHELGHAAGGLRHGDGYDNPGLLMPCDNGVLDDDDDQCEEAARLDGQNLMQYRTGAELSDEQILLMRAHMQSTLPDLQAEVTSSGATDTASIEEEFANILEFEFANILEFEFVNILEFEFVNILEFEFVNILEFEFANILEFEFANIPEFEFANIPEFEEAEVLDFEFANILEFGMDFTADPVTGTGEVQVYAAAGGLPWPTPIRPKTGYFWYLNLDEDPATGRRPGDFGFPDARVDDTGVDVIVMLDLFSSCNELTLVCSDYAFTTVLAFDTTAQNFIKTYGPVPSTDAIKPITLGLAQDTVDPAREDPAVGMLLAPSFPASILVDAVPSYRPGDPIAMQVVTAIPCEQTLPDGTVLDCQCTNCGACPDYPGCEVPEGDPDPVKVCSDGTTLCASDADCFDGGECGGQTVCSIGGNACVSNADCTAGDGDFCVGAALLTADSPGAILAFEPPVLPSCEVVPVVTDPGVLITVVASDFPTETSQPMNVLIGEQVVGGDASPVFDVEGKTPFDVAVPADALPGPLEFTVELEGFATEANCSVVVLAVNCFGDPASGDSDGDGHCDDVDNCPWDSNSGQGDTDGDAVGDACDTCPGDPEDDSDGDGVCIGDGFHLPATGDRDNCPDYANVDQADQDEDGQGNICDDDDDNDGVVDDSDSHPLNPLMCRDVDSDTCDDCSSGTDNPANDGADSDS
jgi:hypothetical protein